MTPEQFAYWLQGFAEMNGGKLPSAAQWKSIKEHLATVFVKVTPPVDAAKSTKPLRLDEKKLEEMLKDMEHSHSRPSNIYPERIC